MPTYARNLSNLRATLGCADSGATNGEGRKCAKHEGDQAHHLRALKNAVDPHLADEVTLIERGELVLQRVDVVVDRVKADAQLNGNVDALVALADQLSDFALTRR